jgi:hypothetical protein
MDRAGNATDPAAIAAEIRADSDIWHAEESGQRHREYYLVAADRDEALPLEEAKRLGCRTGDRTDDGKVRCRVTGRVAIERYLRDVAAHDPTLDVPPDRRLGFERIEPGPDDAKDRRPRWRSYLLEQRGLVVAITHASASHDKNTDRAIVLVELDAAGARMFGDLTTRIVEHKLAIVLDERITSAPVIETPIRGGRASITMGARDQEVQDRDADTLAKVLSAGALPGPAREESMRKIPAN